MQFDMDLHVDYAKAGLPVPPEQPWMNVYLHKPSDEMPAIRRKPMMIVCPGGGYQMRSDREAEPIALQWMAALLRPAQPLPDCRTAAGRGRAPGSPACR